MRKAELPTMIRTAAVMQCISLPAGHHYLLGCRLP